MSSPYKSAAHLLKTKCKADESVAGVGRAAESDGAISVLFSAWNMQKRFEAEQEARDDFVADIDNGLTPVYTGVDPNGCVSLDSGQVWNILANPQSDVLSPPERQNYDQVLLAASVLVIARVHVEIISGEHVTELWS